MQPIDWKVKEPMLHTPQKKIKFTNLDKQGIIDQLVCERSRAAAGQ